MTTHTNRYGALAKRAFQPRLRTPGRNDDEYLFRSPANAERLLEALEDSRAGRNMIPLSIEELEALFKREPR